MLRPVVNLTTVDSTNSEAQRRAAKGETGPLWICAQQQTGGRGRSGRAWRSPAGNLYATLLFAPGCAPGQLHHLSLVAGLAAHNVAVRGTNSAAQSHSIRLKWPNDVMIGEAKVAGILVESSVFDGVVLAAVGFGLNVAVAPRIDDRKVTSLQDQGASVAVPDSLAWLDEAFFGYLATWQHGDGFGHIRAAWLERSHTPGQPMAINAQEGTVRGTFQGIDEDGALLLSESSGTVRRFHFGDVVVGGGAAAQYDGE